MGSIALGSLILAVIGIVNAMMKFLTSQIEKLSGENCMVKCLTYSFTLCIDCFDRFLRYITQNAYIYMALSNESFCTASVHAFLLILKNSAKFSMVSGIASVFMFIAKICISVMTTVIGYLLLKPLVPFNESLTDTVVPTLLIFMISYLISSIFIGVFDAGSNTIL